MFWCLPPDSKCEWSTLQWFVEQFNTQFGTQYQPVKCLDVKDRSQPQPEILLENEEGKCIVIERKVLVWPPDYLKYHRSQHEFFKYFTTMLGSAFQDDAYLLEINANHLRGNKKKIENIAQKIARIVLDRRKQILDTGEFSSARPIPWRFWRLSEFERDEITPKYGVGVICNKPVTSIRDSSILDFKLLETQQGLAKELEKQLTNAALKFKNYSSCLRILILEVYGDDITLDIVNIDEIIQSAKVPLNIDQIWLAEPEWINLSEYRVVYRQVKVRCGQHGR